MAASLAALLFLSAPGTRAAEGLVAAHPSADHVVVVKHRRRLYLLNHGHVVAAMKIHLGRHPRGPKIRAGDRRTPEGNYILDRRNPDSHYTLALHISYPNAGDLARARRLGVAPGDNIEIHGWPTDTTSWGLMKRDWTAGCIALSNRDMRRLWSAVEDGTPIEIKP